MKLDAGLLVSAMGCTPERAELYGQHLSEACEHFGIDTPERLAAFLAQIGHESGSLRYVREIADGSAYEGRKDLGNVNPGDGTRYRGRGLIQVTGRDNYRQMTGLLSQMGAPDFEALPSELESPRWAAWSAAAWWNSRNLSHLADRGEFDLITRRINGGTNGHADRRARWERAKAALLQPRGSSSENPGHSPAEGYTTPTPPIPHDGGHPAIPAGEAPGWIPGGNMPALAPIIAAVLPSIIEGIPKLGKLFGSGSEVAERNIKAAELVVDAAIKATGAVNAQDAAEKIKTDPAAAQAAAKAVDSIWYELTEAGGGGIEGARRADEVTRQRGDLLQSASFWIAMLLLPLVYLLVLSLIGMVGSAQWSDDVRAGLAGSLISAIIGGLVGYYYGTTTSRNRTP